MIEIKILNCVEIAKSRNLAAKLIPSFMLKRIVEKAVAKELQEKLVQEGIEAVVIVVKARN